ncbi:hypothetical protein SeMB42_g03876 [Synchytrium endobioticum]|uniref:Cation efflux protein transmembrane domain-containing protein n=1 Tax=Synchytrium endobioticum TaxID=286115 RepID=A0A507D318_9FUNG|nr:hypothetical protein SeMB42_g03876 [Synchytrium endobioticum]TPX47966.1 hypothetical protein SeLEV6574_g02320 [Synchytrium endobioticum]
MIIRAAIPYTATCASASDSAYIFTFAYTYTTCRLTCRSLGPATRKAAFQPRIHIIWPAPHHAVASLRLRVPHPHLRTSSLSSSMTHPPNRSTTPSPCRPPTNAQNTIAIENWVGEWKSQIKRMRREVKLSKVKSDRKRSLQSSAKVVAFAISTNLIMFTAKLYAAISSGSASMYSEALHSFADVLNECILMIGIWRSLKAPDPSHPYGFAMERYAWALISGMGIFFLGGGVSMYHGISGLVSHHVIGDPTAAWLALAGSMLFEGITLTYALSHIRREARAAGVSTTEYIHRGADPTTVQVFIEDCTAITGVALAGTCLSLAKYLDMPWIDSAGSISIAVLLGSAAIFLIRRNIAALVETSMHPARQREIVQVLEKDPVVASVHDVKSTTLGPEWVRFKAEILINGEQVARRMYDRNPNLCKREFQELKRVSSEKELKNWMILSGGKVVSALGWEVDRLENNIKKKVPEARHIDLEVL